MARFLAAAKRIFARIPSCQASSGCLAMSFMRILAFLFLLVSAGLLRADLTIVQEVEGVPLPGKEGPSQITIRMKDGKIRIDTGTIVSALIDAKSGDVATLMHEQKRIVRISSERAVAMAEMINRTQNNEQKESKLTATGRKETIDGMETEIYTADTGQGKATCWIARNYPNGPEILKQLQAMQPNAWKLANTGMPDFRDFPGLPIKTTIENGGRLITAKLVSAKQGPLPDSVFTPPADYTEIKLPNIFSGEKKPGAAPTASP